MLERRCEHGEDGPSHEIAEVGQETKRRGQFSSWDFAYAVDMGFACLISYWVITVGLARLVDKPADFLGGMWAVAATVFVFRDTRSKSLSAGLSRLIATLVSFALCQAYLLIFPFPPRAWRFSWP